MTGMRWTHFADMSSILLLGECFACGCWVTIMAQHSSSARDELEEDLCCIVAREREREREREILKPLS
jgi:hypothetical protein